MHGHELQRRDAEPAQVLDGRGVGDAGIRPADLLGHVGMAHRQPLDVRLIDDRLVVAVPRRAVLAPVEERVGDHREHRVPERVDLVGHGRQTELRIVEGVAEQRLVAAHLPVDGLGVWVQQQLGRVAAMPVCRVVGAVDAVAVALARLHRRQIDVPDERVVLGHLDAGLGAVIGDEAQLDTISDLGEQREVDPRPVVGRTEGVGLSGPDLHRHLHGWLGMDEGGMPSGRLPASPPDTPILPGHPQRGHRIPLPRG
jgi:hypothetical protein